MIMLASNFGHTKLVSYLLAHIGSNDLNNQVRGKTALLLACENKKFEVVKLLLARDDLNVDGVDYKGCTALHYASLHGNFEIVTEILSHSNFFNINQRNVEGNTAWSVAFWHNYEIAKLISSQQEYIDGGVSDAGSEDDEFYEF